MTEGFQLNPAEIAEQIHEDIISGQAVLRLSFDAYARPDYEIGMTIVHDPVDRAVITFVGSREEAARVMGAARHALNTKEAA